MGDLISKALISNTAHFSNVHSQQNRHLMELKEACVIVEAGYKSVGLFSIPHVCCINTVIIT